MRRSILKHVTLILLSSDTELLFLAYIDFDWLRYFFWKRCTDEHSQFIEHCVEKYPMCIVKDVTDELCKAFKGRKTNQGTAGKLLFTLTPTQPKVAEPNCEDIIKTHCQFVVYYQE